MLVGSATRNGVTVVSAVLGEPSEAARDADTLALLRYGLRSYRGRPRRCAGRASRPRPKLALSATSTSTSSPPRRRAASCAAASACTVARRRRARRARRPAPRGRARRHGGRAARAAAKVARVPLVTAAPVARGDVRRAARRTRSAADPHRCSSASSWPCSLLVMVLRRRQSGASRRRRRERRREAEAA